MKLIHKHNFFAIVCVAFTIVVCTKLLAEKIAGVTDPYYTENIFTCLFFSAVITFIFAAHYYLQQFPFVPVALGQYAVTLGLIMLFVWVMGHFSETSEGAYRDMILSVTIPYLIGAAVYYITFFREIRKANRVLEQLGGTPAFDPLKQEAIIRASICTGEKVAGFKNKEDGHFTEICVIRTPKDEAEFKEKYHIEQIKVEY